ncbi:MAG: phosphatase domain-containing protein [Myxococcota bacterium]
MHVLRWDLDRTYLETEITSLRGLVRAALEDAATKRTVPGAAALIRGLCQHDPLAEVRILSGSPTQMREVLLQKLALDGVRVDRLILKDNLGNLRRGRLRAVRGQVGYKLPELLEDRVDVPSSARETLFGDDSEADALIYAAYAALLAGELHVDDLVRILQAGGAYPDAVDRAVAAARRVAQADAVDGIFIRVDRGVPVSVYRTLGSRVWPVFSWLQAALVLWGRERLPESALHEVAESVEAPEARVGLLVDAVRRGLVDGEAIERALALPTFEAIAPAARRAVAQLGPPQPVSVPAIPDYLAFLAAVR